MPAPKTPLPAALADAGARPATLAEALVALQASMPRVGTERVADTGKYQYRYAGLHDVVEALYPALSAVGLAFTAAPTMVDGRFVLEYALRHVSGEQVTGLYPLADPTRATGQQIGSSITYARRYALSAVTGLVVDPDDDGAEAGRAEPVAPVTKDPRHFADLVRRIGEAETPGVLSGLKAEAGTLVNKRALADEDVQQLRALFAEAEARTAVRPA